MNLIMRYILFWCILCIIFIIFNHINIIIVESLHDIIVTTVPLPRPQHVDSAPGSLLYTF